MAHFLRSSKVVLLASPIPCLLAVLFAQNMADSEPWFTRHNKHCTHFTKHCGTRMKCLPQPWLLPSLHHTILPYGVSDFRHFLHLSACARRWFLQLKPLRDMSFPKLRVGCVHYAAKCGNLVHRGAMLALFRNLFRSVRITVFGCND